MTGVLYMDSTMRWCYLHLHIWSDSDRIDRTTHQPTHHFPVISTMRQVWSSIDWTS